MHNCPRCALADDLVELSDGTPEMEALINYAVRRTIDPGPMMSPEETWRWWRSALELYRQQPGMESYYVIMSVAPEFSGPSRN